METAGGIQALVFTNFDFNNIFEIGCGADNANVTLGSSKFLVKKILKNPNGYKILYCISHDYKHASIIR